MKNNYIKLKFILDDVSKFEKNWNGYSADPISKIVLIKAYSFLEFLNKNNLITDDLFISPTARKTIQFEYENDKSYFEIEIYMDSYYIFWKDKQLLIGEENVLLKLDEVKLEIEEFYKIKKE